MKQKERIKNLVSMYQTRIAHFDKTREIQWKFNGILWTGLIVSTPFVYGKKIYCSLHIAWFILIATVVTMIHFSLIHKTQSSLDFDKDLWITYGKEIDKFILRKSNKCIPASNQSYKSLGWILIQIAITIVLLTIVGFAAYTEIQ
jgi:hypothetical protein